ncbi:lysophospholipid acyltransferase family protein [Reinekea blandensis]|uniref:L-ornithine N(alpha)-acyltransferase n=1 Tax=Reinekea blandensis MED297 TaxID=314283 RepID=A4BI65_9GAMM|nr:GNAT family N-acyltransferase [Reinekea blandensis]EAR08208.1 putative hemolysin [Reinekea sp. MED297] [Reinekea blandensis MED297]
MDMTTQNPFRLPSLPSALAAATERLLGLTVLAKHYDRRPKNASPERFLDYTLQALDCRVTLDGLDLGAALPEQGPVVVVANHPFGGLEGVALTRALLAIRPDTRVLTNQMLSTIPELSPIFFGVDVLNDKAAHRNTASVRAAANHLENQGVLLVFPAGQVSAASWSRWQVTDRRWNPMVGRLIQKYQADCLPVYVHGQNPTYFQLAGLVHRRLRTLLLPRQLTNKSGQALHLTVGERIRKQDLRSLNSASRVTDTVRMATYLLRHADQQERQPALTPLQPHTGPDQSAAIHHELDKLTPYRLLSKGSFDVYCAPYHALHHVFNALAEAREQTFRAAGEGTGKTRDTDRFDPHYHHLFVWDRDAQAIVGGYRLGETDKIVDQFGVNGLYSRSLYRFDADYIRGLGPALEVGRSFVTQAYQRHPAALDLLWRGIGQFVVRHPQYRVLFGCVSISSDHSNMARAFISDAMMESYRAEQRFLDNVKPRVPLKVRGKTWTTGMLRSIQDISVFNKLVGLCDPGRAIPVLLRHYIALNGRFVGFAVNPGFNDSLDGLILVDLHNMPERYLKRYLGAEGKLTYQDYWDRHENTLLRQ